LYHPTLDGNGIKAMPGGLMYPILVHLQKKRKYKKQNMANQKKNIYKKSYISYKQA
jgi:hypothetical protein